MRAVKTQLLADRPQCGSQPPRPDYPPNCKASTKGLPELASTFPGTPKAAQKPQRKPHQKAPEMSQYIHVTILLPACPEIRKQSQASS